jgi:hypothetical protein
MTPELRNWYLSNLGIVQYVPKGEEPVALQFQTSLHAPRPDHEQIPEREVKTRAASVLEMVQAEPVSSPLPDQSPASLKTDAGKDAGKKASAVAGENTSPGGTDIVQATGEGSANPVASSLNFRLACWHPCDDILVFNQLEPGESPDVEQNQLLSNILRAIGRLPEGLPVPECIDWPMANSANAHHSRIGVPGKSDAQAMLSVFLDARIRKHGVLWVLLMGELATELLCPRDIPYTDLLGSEEEIAGGAKILVTRSLQEMLMQPELKSETWRTLRCLVQES